MNVDDEGYILVLLSDSNLPTGSFVASSGLESAAKHGFSTTTDSTVAYIRDSLHTYSRSALPFVTDAWETMDLFKRGTLDMEKALELLIQLDKLYDSMTLHHVARRASKSQGVALLTLHSKGFSKPSVQTDQAQDLTRLVLRIKTLIRKEETPGHLPICWAILTASLGLSLERSRDLHLFLHGRGLVSAAVRLNTFGPYVAQQILLHDVKELVAIECAQTKYSHTGVLSMLQEEEFNFIEEGPSNTWPLGEILAARHDLQHSRIFNS